MNLLDHSDTQDTIYLVVDNLPDVHLHLPLGHKEQFILHQEPEGSRHILVFFSLLYFYLFYLFYLLHFPNYPSLSFSPTFILVSNLYLSSSSPAPVPYLAEAMIWCLASLTSLSHLAHTMAGPPGEEARRNRCRRQVGV